MQICVTLSLEEALQKPQKDINTDKQNWYGKNLEKIRIGIGKKVNLCNYAMISKGNSGSPSLQS